MFAIGAYVLWGFLPVYFVLLSVASAFEIVGWRILFSLVFCALLITATRAWRPLMALARDRRVMLTLAGAGALIYVNWQVYVLASTTGHIVEASLGYFINPIVTVLLGVIVLRERLRRWQWVAVGVSFAAVLVIAIGYGQFPWISLALAGSFGVYGFIKKRVGGRVDAVSGLTLETMWLVPVAVVQLFVVNGVVGLTIASEGAGHTLLLLAAGAVTAVPLLFFAAGARRLSLTVLGLTQYFAPVLQLLVGVVIMHEPMPLERWIGFGLVWIALAILTIDMIVAGRGPRRASLERV
ncbi:EamA family transporter RarD [Homoserinibacter sp. YIM 151385]|nr:EamA family transporter RarD [Homoserinibacter sp. YIM 151385]WBU39414.1 EamA family transporter RarD [Homoserinibacter sp. YIM 151385]